MVQRQCLVFNCKPKSLTGSSNKYFTLLFTDLQVRQFTRLTLLTPPHLQQTTIIRTIKYNNQYSFVRRPSYGIREIVETVSLMDNVY